MVSQPWQVHQHLETKGGVPIAFPSLHFSTFYPHMLCSGLALPAEFSGIISGAICCLLWCHSLPRYGPTQWHFEFGSPSSHKWTFCWLKQLSSWNQPFCLRLIWAEQVPKCITQKWCQAQDDHNGLTKLHMDLTDAVNIMLWAGHCYDRSPGYALWHLYPPQMANILQLFFKEEGLYKGAGDFIHS